MVTIMYLLGTPIITNILGTKLWVTSSLGMSSLDIAKYISIFLDMLGILSRVDKPGLIFTLARF